jgi:hypothetical protein
MTSTIKAVVVLIACVFLCVSIWWFGIDVGAQSNTTSISGKFYKFDILSTGAFVSDVSINDRGVVAYGDTYHVYTADGIGSPQTIASGGGTLFLNGGHQINNAGLLATHFTFASSGTQQLRTFDTSQQNPQPSTVASSVGEGSLLARNSFALANENGQPKLAFVKRGSTNGTLFTGIDPNFSSRSVPRFYKRRYNSTGDIGQWKRCYTGWEYQYISHSDVQLQPRYSN